MKLSKSTQDSEPLSLGISLTAIQMSMFFSFILISSFAPDLLKIKVPLVELPLSFMWGLAVIFCGVLLTVFYVNHTNSREG